MKAVHTRIMATLADNRTTPEFVAGLYERGMRGVRINSAHVNPESIGRIISIVRSVAPDIKILMDTKGPEMRTTALARGLQGVMLEKGAIVEVRGGVSATDRGEIYLNAMSLGKCLKPGNRLFIDDGAITLEVVEITGENSLSCLVVDGNELGSRKSVSLSEDAVIPKLPAVSEKDRINIAAALDCGIDMIAHSFVRDVDDVAQVRAELGSAPVTLFAKVESREALDNLDAIAAAADGLLVARGDLGAQIPIERVPAVQSRIMELCRRTGKSSIISTQILQSMIVNAAPTRAEVSDIALGVMQGADWLLLTGETALGAHPAECVDVMRRTIEETSDYLGLCSAK